MLISIMIICLAVLIIHDLNKSNSQSIVQNVLTRQKFDQISIDTNNLNIRIKKGDHYRVLFEGNQKLIPEVEVKEKRLIIKDKSGSIIINGNLFDLLKKHALVPQMTIELPDKEIKKVNIDSSNGNIKVQNVAVNQGKIALSNGNVAVDHSLAEGYELDTANGNVVINGSNVGNYYKKNDHSRKILNVDNSNGDIVIGYGG